MLTLAKSAVSREAFPAWTLKGGSRLSITERLPTWGQVLVLGLILIAVAFVLGVPFA